MPTSIVVAGSKKVMTSGKKKQSSVAGSNVYMPPEEWDYFEYESDEKANRELLDNFGARGGPTHPLVGMDLRVSY